MLRRIITRILHTLTVGAIGAYLILALISLPDAFHHGASAIAAWVWQLMLLAVVLGGQQGLAKLSNEQAQQTFRDAEAVRRLTGRVHRLIDVRR